MVILFLLLNILFIQNNSQIKENPINLTSSLNNRLYPLVLTSSDEYYYVLTSMNDLQIEKESGDVKNIKENNIISQNTIHHVDNSNNNYLFNWNDYYFINYNPFISYQNYQMNLQPNGFNINILKNIGIIQFDNDVIIYGYYDKELFFCSKSQQYCSSFSYQNPMKQLSCKFIEEEYCLCAMVTKKFHEDI